MSEREWLKQIDDALEEDDEEDQPRHKKSRKYVFSISSISNFRITINHIQILQNRSRT